MTAPTPDPTTATAPTSARSGDGDIRERLEDWLIDNNWSDAYDLSHALMSSGFITPTVDGATVDEAAVCDCAAPPPPPDAGLRTALERIQELTDTPTVIVGRSSAFLVYDEVRKIAHGVLADHPAPQTAVTDEGIIARLRCTVCDEFLMPFEEAVTDPSVETDDRWAHRDCMEAGE